MGSLAKLAAEASGAVGLWGQEAEGERPTATQVRPREEPDPVSVRVCARMCVCKMSILLRPTSSFTTS